MDALVTRLLEGLTIWQALIFIVLCLMLRFLYDIKITLIKSRAWQEKHEEIDNLRFSQLFSQLGIEKEPNNG